MVTGYIFTAFLIILGLAVMRFGSIHFKKFKEGKTKIKSKLSGQLSFFNFVRNNNWIDSLFSQRSII